ncbi:MAG: hypothetical protein Q8900_01700 [Bacillota bacterium]|nr:hypothetical protein [Bacillota bacterium]
MKMKFNKNESVISTFLNIVVLLTWILGSYGILRTNIIFITISFFTGIIVIIYLIKKIAMLQKKMLQKKFKLFENIQFIKYIFIINLISIYLYVFITRFVEVFNAFNIVLDSGKIFLYEFIIGSTVIIFISLLFIFMINSLNKDE